jgi:hypothetical protein
MEFGRIIAIGGVGGKMEFGRTIAIGAGGTDAIFNISNVFIEIRFDISRRAKLRGIFEYFVASARNSIKVYLNIVNSMLFILRNSFCGYIL